MDEQLRQIGERLRGLRDVLDIEASEMATLCGISLENYLAMEKGESELSVANLQKIAKQYGVSLDVLMFGEEPKMSSYFLTRKGHGMSVERRSAYNYESLASGFRGRKADPDRTGPMGSLSRRSLQHPWLGLLRPGTEAGNRKVSEKEGYRPRTSRTLSITDRLSLS